MAKSIIQKEKECLICGYTRDLEKHHCMHGTANRRKAEKYGLTVWLCRRHHTGPEGVHMDAETDLEMKKLAQHVFEENYGHEKWMEVFGRNYL